MLENINAARKNGADIAVIAPPPMVMPRKSEVVLNTYLETIRHSTLPIGVYDTGMYSPVALSNEHLAKIYAQKNVILVKDSSNDPRRIKVNIAARKKRPRLALLNGYEFNNVAYLKAGYDGLLQGGGVFNGYLARQIMKAFADGNLVLAQKLQDRMNRLMFAAYGGKKIACWLAGEKRLLVEMGIFKTWKNYLGYPLTNSCVKAIKNIVKKEARILFP